MRLVKAGLLILLLIAILSPLFMWNKLAADINVINESSQSNFKVSKILMNLFLWRVGYLDKTKTVNITYTDEVQQIFQLNYLDERVVSIGGNKNEEIINLYIEYSPDHFAVIKEIPDWFTTDALAGICILEEGKEINPDGCYIKASTFVNEVSQFRVGEIVTISRNLISFLQSILIKTATAQTCVGSIPCGTWVNNTACRHNDYNTIVEPCTTPGTSCYDGQGTCIITGQRCETNSNFLNCGSLNNQTNCQNQGNVSSCAYGCNPTAENFCTWIPPAPPPPQSPPPPPPPPSGYVPPPSQTPGSPSPSPGGCDYYGCINGQAINYGNDPTCNNTSPCQCGIPPCPTNTKGGEMIYLYNDINNNGVWNPDAGELRFSADNGCTPNHGDYFGQYTAAQQTALGIPPNSINLYWNGSTSRSSGSCNISGPGWNHEIQDSICNTAAEANIANNSCIATAYDCDGANRYGRYCRNGSGYCQSETTGAPRNLQPGNIFWFRETEGWYTVELDLPDGWSISPQTINALWGSGTFGNFQLLENGNYRFVTYVDAHSNIDYVCSKVTGIGIYRNYGKQCWVATSANQISTGGSIVLSAAGYSNMPGSERTGLWITRKSNTSPARPLAMSPAPANTTAYSTADGTYYRFNDGYFECITGNGNMCNDQITISNLPTGTYTVHCDLATGPQQCSGNPYCVQEGQGGAINCSWPSCTAQDNATFTVSCVDTTSCTNQCGGTDTCGNPCGTANLGQPTTPSDITFSSPAISGTNVNMTGDADGRVQIGWTSTGPRTGAYEVVIYPASVDPGITNPAFNCTNNQYCTRLPATTLSTLYQPQASHGHSMRVSVRGVNTLCPQNGNWRTESVTLTGNIAASFYLDQSSPSGSCTGTAQGAIIPGLSSTAPLSTLTISNSTLGTRTNEVSGSTFTVSNYPYSPASWGRSIIGRLRINNSDPENHYVCAPCNQQSPSDRYLCEETDITSPGTARFYLQKYNLSNGPWWQVANGLFYANSGFGTNNIPNDTCTLPGCNPYFAISGTGSMSDLALAGIPIANGNISTPNGYWSERQRNTTNTPERRAQGQDFSRVPVENYTYLSTLYDLNSIQRKIPNDTILNTFDNLINNSAFDSITEGDATIFATAGNLVVRPGASNSWVVPAGAKYIVFVDGNLTLDSVSTTNQIIRVEEDGFLAFIVRNDIIVSQNVGNTTLADNTTNLEGVFIGRSITIANDDNPSTTDRKFVGAGTFVGWDGIYLERSFDDGDLGRVNHNTIPTHYFTYRPDFLINAPESLLQSDITWRVTND